MDTKAVHKLWSYLHSHPEVSWEEKATTSYLMNLFEEQGLHPTAFQSIPGFYVEVGKGRPVVGLRADMDALFQEVDGSMQANHSCGHDAHMTMVTAAVLRLQKQADSLNGTVRAIFQPAEEIGNGAAKVVDEGIADDLDYLFGVHVRPKNEIPFPNCAPAIDHGACVFAKGTIKGEDHHGARPQEGINGIEVGYSIMQHIRQIHTPPMIPASIKMTNLHAGGKNLNIIPGSATFGLDIRAQSNEVMDMLKARTQDIIVKIGEFYQRDIELVFEDDVPAAVIHPEAEQVMSEAIEKVLGKNETQKRIITSGSDDFHFYTLLRPHIKATMLALGADVTPGLHHPKMVFNQEALENGISILMNACLSVLR